MTTANFAETPFSGETETKVIEVAREIAIRKGVDPSDIFIKKSKANEGTLLVASKSYDIFSEAVKEAKRAIASKRKNLPVEDTEKQGKPKETK